MSALLGDLLRLLCHLVLCTCLSHQPPLTTLSFSRTVLSMDVGPGALLAPHQGGNHGYSALP